MLAPITTARDPLRRAGMTAPFVTLFRNIVP